MKRELNVLLLLQGARLSSWLTVDCGELPTCRAAANNNITYPSHHFYYSCGVCNNIAENKGSCDDLGVFRHIFHGVPNLYIISLIKVS